MNIVSTNVAVFNSVMFDPVLFDPVCKLPKVGKESLLRTRCYTHTLIFN